MTENDDLDGFLQWWMQNRPINTPEDDSLVYQKDTHGVVLYRQPPYQVELFILQPNSEIVPHIHPNVDSFEVYVSGDIELMREGTWYDQAVLGTPIRIKPSDWHAGLIGKRGACFLSVQKWLNDVKPTFVGNDWRDENDNVAYRDT